VKPAAVKTVVPESPGAVTVTVVGVAIRVGALTRVTVAVPVEVDQSGLLGSYIAVTVFAPRVNELACTENVQDPLAKVQLPRLSLPIEKVTVPVGTSVDVMESVTVAVRVEVPEAPIAMGDAVTVVVVVSETSTVWKLETDGG
jgi:hypothetical protein